MAGGTMEPIDDLIAQLMPGIEGEKGIERFGCGHVVPRTSVLCCAVGSGVRGGAMEFTFDRRGDGTLLGDLGESIAQLCTTIPYGVVVFLSSYAYLDLVRVHWTKSGILSRIESGVNGKRCFFEPRVAGEVEATLRAYADGIKRAGENVGSGGSGKKGGCVLFAIVGGKMSEGINFSDNLARAVIMVGLPFPNKRSPELMEKMSFIAKTGSNANEYYENICMRALNQSIGRAIRHKNDYAAIFLLDKRFTTSESVRAKLPRWIREAGVEVCGGGVREADERARRFFATFH
ncbi:ATP-dependent DNA helicase chl1 [Irineochytrium annulatum]|nr:ATP-dependent DNA helicase chl1 [Irineochytrium annulatum]